MSFLTLYLMNKKKIIRNSFYIFLIINILLILYFNYTWNSYINLDNIKNYFSAQNLYIWLLLYIFILTVRWLTIFPWTPLLVLWTLLFPKVYVILSIEIAIVLYTIIIYKYTKILDFKVPDKVLKFEKKIKRYEILSIFALCFIPGVSINLLAYFCSTLKIDIKKILIWLVAWTSITSIIYISLIELVFSPIT